MTKHLVAAFAIAALACSSSGGGDGGGGTPSTALTTLCSGFVDAVASQYATCLEATPTIVASMKTLTTGVCQDIANAVAASRATYDGAKGTTCLAALQAATCASTEVTLDSAACSGVLTGTVAPGGACFTDLDCNGGLCNLNETCPGKCVAFIAAGGACGSGAPEGAACAPGLGCDNASQTCKTLSDAGGPCPCKAGTYCNATNSCVARQTSGSCTSSDQCAFGHDCVSSTCTAFVGVGSGCVAGATPYDRSRCGLGSYCDPGTSTCVAWPDVGGSCAYAPCQNGYCDSGTKLCVAPLADGATCSDFSQCLIGSYCDVLGDDTCKVSKANGAACTSLIECASFNCVSGSCAPDPMTCHET